MNRLYFALFCVLVLWGVTTIFMFDYISVPRENREHIVGEPQFEDPSRFWEINIGNGFMSNIENILFLGCSFFGFLRLFDVMKMLCIDEDD